MQSTLYLIRVLSVLFAVAYGLTFAILAILQASLGQYKYAAQDVAYMAFSIVFGALIHKLVGLYMVGQKRGKSKRT